MKRPTENLRQQHKNILSLAGQVSEFLKDIDSAQQAEFEIRKHLASLTGALKVHLAMEDKVIYPMLFANPDPAISKLAKQYQDEMGGLGAAYTAYAERWQRANEIKSDPGSFIKETNDVFSALKERIAREDEELYELYDKFYAIRAAR